MFFFKKKSQLIVLSTMILPALVLSGLGLLHVWGQAVNEYPIAQQITNDADCFGGYSWCFDGKTAPGEGQLPSQMWDNPIDDQWKRQDFRQGVYSMVSETNGTSTIDYVHVDRSVIDGPSWILLKDPKMNYSSGFEVQTSVRIPETSDRGSVALIAITEKNHFAIIFEKDRVIFNPVGNQRYMERKYLEYPLDLSKSFSTIAISQKPESNEVDVDLMKPDGSKVSIFKAVRSTLYSRGYGFRTQLSFGDNQDDYINSSGNIVRVRGVYDLDFIRIKKIINTTDEYPVPTGATLSTQDPLFFGMLAATSSSGNLKFNQIIPNYNPGYEDDFSVAWNMSLSALESEKSHVSFFLKGLSYTFEFSNLGVRLKSYGKPVGSSVTALTPFTGNKSEACFRIVHSANSPYVNLYINNNPQPIIANAKGSAAGWSSSSSAFVLFGKENVPSSMQDAWSSIGTLPGLGAYKGLTNFYFFKFAQGAYLPKAGDVECAHLDVLGMNSNNASTTSVAPGQTSIKTTQLTLNSYAMSRDVYFDAINADYVDNTNLDFRNCIVYSGNLRLNGTVVNATSSGIKTFILDKRLFVPRSTTTEVTIACTIPQGTPTADAFAFWRTIDLLPKQDFVVNLNYTPLVVNIKK